MLSPKVIRLPRHSDSRGSLSFLENGPGLPFGIRRAYWIYDVPGGEVRGGHGYKVNHELIIALSGSFDVVCKWGGKTEVFQLNRSYTALYVPPGTWRQLENFSTNSLALVVASAAYDRADYFFEPSLELNEHPSVMPSTGLEHNNAPELKVPSFLDSRVEDCSVLTLPTHVFPNGDLTVAQSLNGFFDIQRVFFLYDIKSGASRGGHAHKELTQGIVAASGGFDVVLHDTHRSRTVHLNQPNQVLLTPPGIWADLERFSSASVCMVLASMPYDENDYLRSYDKFDSEKNK